MALLKWYDLQVAGSRVGVLEAILDDGIKEFLVLQPLWAGDIDFLQTVGAAPPQEAGTEWTLRKVVLKASRPHQSRDSTDPPGKALPASVF